MKTFYFSNLSVQDPDENHSNILPIGQGRKGKRNKGTTYISKILKPLMYIETKKKKSLSKQKTQLTKALSATARF